MPYMSCVVILQKFIQGIQRPVESENEKNLSEGSLYQKNLVLVGFPSPDPSVIMLFHE